LHLYDPHSPYDPPEPYSTQYRGHLYDGEIAYADHELGRLITWLKLNKLYDRSLIAFLSDHGESLSEHGEQEHGFFIYNATGSCAADRETACWERHSAGTDLPAGGNGCGGSNLGTHREDQDAIEKQFQSQGLFGVGAEAEDESYSETFYPFSSFGWNPLHALETSRYHYIDAPNPELYDLIADPRRRKNLAPQQTATIAVLKEKLETRLRTHPFTLSQVGGQDGSST